MIHNVHAFRGEYIDLCAQVERWATSALRSEAAAKTGRVDLKLPYLFGHKLKLIAELAAVEPGVFSKPSSVARLMADFEPFAKLRSELAHAVVQTVNCEAGETYLFELPDIATPAINPARFWLTPLEAAEILRELKAIKKLICDQRPKTLVKACPDPEPCPCPASPSPSASDI